MAKVKDTYNLNEKFGIDDDDRKIMALLQENPNLTHHEIADRINKSQPAVGARILKLERKSLLDTQYAVDLKISKFTILLVSVHAKTPSAILKDLNDCPFAVNAFKTSGPRNLTVLLVGTNLERLETIVERHFRSNPDVQHLTEHIIIEPISRLVLPVNFAFEANQELKCSEECHNRILKLIEEGKDYDPVDENESEVNEMFSVDDVDKRIVMYLQDDPTITHTAIGKKVSKSQPAVGARVSKLKDKGFLGVQKGVNFKTADYFHLVQVSISAMNTLKTLERIKKCPFIVTGYKAAGDTSLIVYVAGHSLEKIDDIIDYCIRTDENVKDVDTKIILKLNGDFVMPYDFQHEHVEDVPCKDCNLCVNLTSKDILDSD